VTPANQTITLGQADPLFTFSLSGFKNGELIGVIGDSTGESRPTCGTASAGPHGIGTYTISCSGGFDDNYTFNTAGTALLTVDYNWTGFFQPLNSDQTVCNVVKAGSAIPLKFSLHGYQGMNIFASGYPMVSTGSCAGASLDPITDGETVTAGNSSLNYDATADQYVYVWKTDKTWAGKAVRLTIILADGTTHYARFSFTK
jgi:hypothetical protein